MGQVREWFMRSIKSGSGSAEPATAQTARVLHDLYLQHGLLLFRDQQLTPAQHIEFSRIFGGLDLHPLKQVRLEGHPEIIALSNKGQSIQAGEEDDVIGKTPWHSDLMFVVRPSRGRCYTRRPYQKKVARLASRTRQRRMTACPTK